ncbi:MAG TPA: hypothetical protein VJ725_12840, partial [Thermoanaerobaculia bacterium]|nr:hypothetical protein [Thermoanaerobaculia bacterium]
RSLDRSMSREMTFLYDLSVATLDRALPILIERLLAAGLAPVFVVDELDKVDQLSQRIVKMVHYLKKLVAERAFFCFLTDRSYFEEMTQRGASRPYPVEYTYFTHRLFVTYQPRDFHAYLDELLLLPQPATPPGPPAAAPAPEVPRDVAIAQEGEVSEDETDRLFLSFVLLHQSQMHALDLHRRLAALNDGKDNVDLHPGEVRDRTSFMAAVIMQLAIEIVFEDPVLLDRLNREPEFGRLVNDALYYLSRCWACDPEIDLGDASEAKFCSYLEGRMGLEEEEEDDPTERAPVSAGNVKLLLGKVRELALLLSDRGRYGNAFQTLNRRREARGEKKIDASVMDLLSGSLGLPLLRQGDTWKFTWRFDSDGIPIESAVPEAAPSAALASAAEPASREVSSGSLDWKVYTDFIENFAKTLEDLTL